MTIPQATLVTKKLRPYQRELLEKVQASLEHADRPVMMQLPTGGGKTVIAAALLSNYLIGGRKAVWLTHRRELASQTEEKLNEEHVQAQFVSSEKWQTGTKAPKIDADVVILMVQTVGRRVLATPDIVWENYDSNDLMIIDEAHHSVAKSWERAIGQWPGRVLGMTATPWRLSKKEGLDKIFGRLISGPQVPDLQAAGFLCQAEMLWPDEGDRIRGGRVGSRGDYTPTGIMEANSNNKEVMTSRAFKFWQDSASDRPTIIYAVSVGHAKNLKELFDKEGITAEVIDKDTPSLECADIIRNFTAHRLKALINVDIATEGFDLPDASCIVITRPTKSLSLYLQMVGRGLRRKEDGGNCLILDLANNRLEHGLPEDVREWSLTAWGETLVGELPTVKCPKCQALSPAASHNCKSCDIPFVKKCQQCRKSPAFRTAWLLEDICSFNHKSACDRCHIDVHVEDNLPFIFPLQQESRYESYYETKLVYKNPIIVARTILAALLDIHGSDKAESMRFKVNNALYKIQGNRRGLDYGKEDLGQVYSLLGTSEDHKLPVPEQFRHLDIFIHKSGIPDKSIENVYDRLTKSGFCIAKQHRKKWRLTQKFLKMVKFVTSTAPDRG